MDQLTRFRYAKKTFRVKAPHKQQILIRHPSGSRIFPPERRLLRFNHTQYAQKCFVFARQIFFKTSL
jgi:hypothetical protein